MKKNEMLPFSSKWMELENIILRPKIVCSASYADFRSRANAAMWLEMGHMTRGEHLREAWG
jgi:hypothetical protein